jgi:photosystem II stability/assembly factor-like uncharacterized protein
MWAMSTKRLLAILATATGLCCPLVPGIGAEPLAGASAAAVYSSGTIRPAPLHIVTRATAYLPSPPTVRSSGPTGGQQAVVFMSPSTGFLLADTISFSTQRTYEPEIQRTTDGGLSWATIWQPGRQPHVDSISRAGHDLVVRGTEPDGRAVTLESADNGRSWQRVAATLENGATPNLPDGTATDVQMVNASAGFATGTVAGTRPKCKSMVWETSDGGARWHALAGSCVGYELGSLSFPNGKEGFAVGAYEQGFLSPPGLAVLSTYDGGEHWHQSFAKPRPGPGPSTAASNMVAPFSQVSFADARHGYALDGICGGGNFGSCVSNLWWTADGGARWHQSTLSGYKLDVAGPADIWVVTLDNALGNDPGNPVVLWHSSDGARTWAAVVDLSRVSESGLLAAGPRLWLSTNAGQFTSTDGGHTWQDAPEAATALTQGTFWEANAGAEGQSSDFAVSSLGGRTSLIATSSKTAELWVSDDGGHSGRTVAVPAMTPFVPVSVALAGGGQALMIGSGGQCGVLPGRAPAMASDDGGKSWHRVGLLPPGWWSSLVYGGSLAVASDGCDMALAISTDGGRRWATWEPAPIEVGVFSCFPAQPSVSGATFTLACPLPDGQSRIFVSQDAGRDWSEYRLAGPLADDFASVVAAGPRDLWATGLNDALWHSTDAGAHWTVSNLTLPVVPSGR